MDQNQFRQSVVKGLVDLRFNHNTFAVRIKSDVTADLVPGQPVRLADIASGVPVVEPITSDEQIVFGFINYNLKDATFTGDDHVEVSCGDNVMYMEAGAAIAVGARVMPVVSGTKVLTLADDKQDVGFALDKAGADGDLIRVVIFGRQSSITQVGE